MTSLDTSCITICSPRGLKEQVRAAIGQHQTPTLAYLRKLCGQDFTTEQLLGAALDVAVDQAGLILDYEATIDLISWEISDFAEVWNLSEVAAADLVSRVEGAAF